MQGIKGGVITSLTKKKSRTAGFAVLRSQNMGTFCKEAQQLTEHGRIEPTFVRYDEQQSSAALYRHFIPNCFNGMQQVISDGRITNCHLICKYYLHGSLGTNLPDDINSSTLIQYLEDDKFKLINMKRFSSGAAAMMCKRKNKQKKNGNKIIKTFFPEQLCTYGKGVYIVKCAMDKSKITNTFHLFVLNLFSNFWYDGGKSLYTFDKEDISDLQSLKKMFAQNLGIKRVLSAFLVVNKDPKLVTQRELKGIDYDDLYGPIVDKNQFPLKPVH